MVKTTVGTRVSGPKIDGRLDSEVEITMQHSLVSRKFRRA